MIHAYPCLRPTISFQSVLYEEQPMWLLEDGWQLSDAQLIFPYPLAKMLTQCDGTRSMETLHAILKDEADDSTIEFSAVTDTISAVQNAGYLVNDHSTKLLQEKLESYLTQSSRPMICADSVYPSDVAQLDTYLQGFSIGIEENEWHGRGLIAPHIDYRRGGDVYAQGWVRSKSVIQAADVVFIWATDHKLGDNALTLSRLPYETPYGVLPTDPSIIERLATAIGRDDAFYAELNHLSEHSVELAAVWLHYLCQESAPIVIPILVGSFNDLHPSEHPAFQRLITEVQAISAEYNVFHVASVDLAHVGAVFNTPIMDEQKKQELIKLDSSLCMAVERGDANEWYELLASNHNENQVCGFSPTYLMLQAMGKVSGKRVAYKQCPADEHGTSIVSICSILLE